jgi:molybdenum cofactor biosynthesis enzyme MoaA
MDRQDRCGCGGRSGAGIGGVEMNETGKESVMVEGLKKIMDGIDACSTLTYHEIARSSATEAVLLMQVAAKLAQVKIDMSLIINAAELERRHK